MEVTVNKIILSALFGSASLLALSPEQQIYSGGVDMKVAKNALSQKLTGANSIFVNSSSQINLFAQPQTTFKFKTIESKSDLRNELDIFGSSSLSVGNFLSTKEGQFYDNFQLNRDKVYILLKRDLTTATDELNESSLIDSAIDMYNNNIDEFRKLYGDLFVSSVIYGNRKFSILQIDVLSPQEKSQIEFYIDTLPVVTTEDSFNNLTAELQTRFRDTNLTHIREDIDSQPYLLLFSPFSSFEEIENLPTTEEQKIQNLQEYVIRDQEYGDILSKIEYIQKTQNRGAEFISEIYGESEVDNSLLEELQLETERQKSRLKGFARDCKKDISCKALSSFDSSEYLRFPQEFELNEQLPMELSRIVLNSCQEHQNYFYQDFRDNNYTIEIRDRDGVEHNVTLFCLDMETLSPDEYLPIANISFATTRDENISIPYLRFNLDSTSTAGLYISTSDSVESIDFDELMRIEIDFSDSDFQLPESFNFNRAENNSSKGYFIIKDGELPPLAESNRVEKVEESSTSHLIEINNRFLNHLDYKIVRDSEERLEFNSSSSMIYFNTVYGSGEPSEIINNGGIELDVK